MAAPTSAAVIKKAHKAYQQHGSFNKAAKAVGISDRTVRKIAQREQWEILPNPTTPDYDAHQKHDIITTFIVLGSIPATAHKHNVSEGTIRNWLKQDWCVTLIDELKQQNKVLLDSQFQSNVIMANEQLRDRITNGDYSNVRDEGGEWIKKPVAAQVLATVAGISYDKLALVRGEGQQQAPGVDALQQMTKLAEAFRAIATDAKVSTASNTASDDAIDITAESDSDQ